MKKRGDRKKSQVATEYIVIVGLVLVILLPSAYLFFTYEKSTSDTIRNSQLESASTVIAKAANELYNFGTSSKTNVEITIPEGVDSIKFEGNEIIFAFKASDGSMNEVAEATDIEMVGDTIENPLPGKLKLDLINLNLKICVTLPGVSCLFCPGVLICDQEFYCEGPEGSGEFESDGICPNEYFPAGYNGVECGTSAEEQCYDPDCEGGA
jgi:uncharacterized protein (UPF0333 family)